MVQLNIDNLKVVSLNTQGMGDMVKRKRVFRYFKLHKADVCFVQETHCTANKEYFWLSEWGNKCIYVNGNSNARGVAILLNCKCANNIEEIRRDIKGYVMCKVLVNEYTYCLCNVYARNKDKPDFFQELFQNIKDVDCVFHIIGGDFNVALNPVMDSSSGTAKP